MSTYDSMLLWPDNQWPDLVWHSWLGGIIWGPPSSSTTWHCLCDAKRKETNKSFWRTTAISLYMSNGLFITLESCFHVVTCWATRWEEGEARWAQGEREGRERRRENLDSRRKWKNVWRLDKAESTRVAGGGGGVRGVVRERAESGRVQVFSYLQ